MADITESAVWEDSIYELATTDPVKGGTPVIGVDGSVVSGHANVQAQKLANRTKYLKQRVDAWPEKVDAAGTALGLINAHNKNPNAHEELIALVSNEVGNATAEADRAEVAADRAEVAAELSSSIGGLFPDTATGISSTTNGEYFSTPGDLAEDYTILYRNEGGVAVEQKRYPSKSLIDDLLGDDPVTPIPQFYETLDPSLWGIVVLSKSGKVLNLFPDATIENRVASLETNSPITGFFESLDPSLSGVLFLTATGLLVSNVQDFSDSISSITSEISNARGSRISLADRLNTGLTRDGDVAGPYLNQHALRDTRMKLRRLELGEGPQIIIGLFGDSYVDGRGYFSDLFTKGLQTKFGDAGAGWVGFGWWGSGTPPFTDVNQPSGVASGVRSDKVSITQLIGTWSKTYNGDSGSPALYAATSTTPGDYIRLSVPAGHNEAVLFYSALAGDGVVQVSWDDGATYSPNIPLTTPVAGNVSIPGIPSGAVTARIKVISGTVGLCGVDLRSSNLGIRVHKLGGSASRTSHWADVDPNIWIPQVTALGCTMNLVLLGTNDSLGGVSPATTRANMETVIDRLALISPESDRMLVMPPENQQTTTYSMPEYTNEVRSAASQRGIGFIDLQYFFGSPENNGAEYGAGSLRPWYSDDKVHPVPLSGGRAIIDAITRFILY